MQVSEASVLIIVDRSSLDSALAEAGGDVGGGAMGISGSSPSGGTATDPSSTPVLHQFRGLTPGATFLGDAMQNSLRSSMERSGVNPALLNRAQATGERISNAGLSVFSRTPAGQRGLATLESLKRGMDTAKEAGRHMGQGTAEGLRGSLVSIERESRSAASSLVRAAREEGEIASPSGKARREIGKQWSEGVAKGISEGKGKLSGAIRRNTDDALNVGVKGRGQRAQRSSLIPPTALMAHMGLVAQSARIGSMVNAEFSKWGKRTASMGRTMGAQRPAMPVQQAQAARAQTPRYNRNSVMSKVAMPTPTRQASGRPSGVKNNFRDLGGSNVSDEVAMNIQRSLRRLGIS